MGRGLVDRAGSDDGLADGAVLLRRPTPADRDAVVAGVLASRASLWPWMDWAREDFGPSHAEAWIAAVEVGDEDGFLVREVDGTIVGGVSLNQHQRRHRVGNLGYWALSSGTGRGLLTRAARLRSLHGLAEEGLHRIEVVMSVHNERSRRLAERLGARYEGRRRAALCIDGEQHDAHAYALTRDDLPRLRADLG